jgi:transposase
MRVTTILNQCERHKGFVYGSARFGEWGGKQCIDVQVRPRKNSRPICSKCGQAGPGYDHLGERRFQDVPIRQFAVFVLYVMRRVDCPRCGVRVERVPWAEGKHFLTVAFQWFLAVWAKRLSWQQVGEAFGVKWDSVYGAVSMAVAWGRARLDLSGILSMGVDEIHWGHGQQAYVTLVYQIDACRKRLLWMGERRTEGTLLRFFHWFGPERSGRLRHVCSDMWKPYIQVIAKKAGQALHVLDRFHIVGHLNKAVDEVRREEAAAMKRRGEEPVLKGARWCLLKKPPHLTASEKPRLRDLLRLNLRTVRAYLLGQDFDQFWDYDSPAWAGKFLDGWCGCAMRSRLKPMKRVARMLRGHRELILNWFRARKAISAGVVEGLNNKAKLGTKMAYGFHTYSCLETPLYHRLGDLPEPEIAHRFC